MFSKPPVIFPDMTLWAITYLRAALAARSEPFASGVSVLTKVPNTVPARLVTIRDNSGSRRADVTKVASLGVNVWAANDADCADLSNLIAALFEASVGNGPVVGHLNSFGPYPVADESARPLRYLTVDLVVRGVPL